MKGNYNDKQNEEQHYEKQKQKKSSTHHLYVHQGHTNELKKLLQSVLC